MLSDITV